MHNSPSWHKVGLFECSKQHFKVRASNCVRTIPNLKLWQTIVDAQNFVRNSGKPLCLHKSAFPTPGKLLCAHKKIKKMWLCVLQNAKSHVICMKAADNRRQKNR